MVSRIFYRNQLRGGIMGTVIIITNKNLHETKEIQE